VDTHPDYLSTRHAETLDMPITRIQHHYAHVRSCMADNGLDAPLLGVAWDGGGSGGDGSVWGGEFIVVRPDRWARAAHLATFPLPGGAYAIREPWRLALGLMEEAGVSIDRFQVPESVASLDRQRQVLAALRTRTAVVPTSSVGRLFDAVASITGIRHRVRFEGQAAMELEAAMGDLQTRESYRLELVGQAPIIIDWRHMVRQIVDDLERGVGRDLMACRFHNALVEALIQVAASVGLERVVLTGGCFQNRYLSEQAVERLLHAGFTPYWHRRVPPNDGGLAVGQLAAVAVRT